MAPFVIACEEPHLVPIHFIFIRFLNRVIESIKHDVAHTFSYVFIPQPNVFTHQRICFEEDEIALSPAKDIMLAIRNKCQLNSEDWSSKDKNFGNKNASYAVFNALEYMLKDSLERLKTMRENISSVKIDLQGYT
ncbi:unnamed protein product [Lupinus luteus]|uniref:Uncharacterized protein n=1 Tax=Lupinus luteus TaxID=3873 RepID=A0AAV1YKF0_LUPLU